MDLDVSADLLYKALKEMDEIELNILNEEASVKHIFTDNFEQNMERMLNKVKRKEWFSSTTVIRKAAMAAIIVLAGLTAVTVTVPAFRKKFIYMLEKTFPKFFEIELDKDRSEEPLKKKDFTLDKVPLGMRLVKRVEGEREVYKNKMGGFLSFKYGEMPGAAVWADIGSLEIQPDKLSGLWQKEKIIGGIKQLTWKDADFIFSISTNENNLDLYTLADQI